MNQEKLSKKGIIYIREDYVDRVFKFVATENDFTCECKLKGEKPYSLDPRSNLAFESLLGGDEITEEEYRIY